MFLRMSLKNQLYVIDLVKSNSIKFIDEFLLVNLNMVVGKAKDTIKEFLKIPTVFKFEPDLLLD